MGELLKIQAYRASYGSDGFSVDFYYVSPEAAINALEKSCEVLDEGLIKVWLFDLVISEAQQGKLTEGLPVNDKDDEGYKVRIVKYSHIS